MPHHFQVAQVVVDDRRRHMGVDQPGRSGDPDLGVDKRPGAAMALTAAPQRTYMPDRTLPTPRPVRGLLQAGARRVVDIPWSRDGTVNAQCARR